MEYSRRDFLGVAGAGLAVVGVSGFLPGAAHAAVETSGAYSQAQADIIHQRSMEQAIRRAGETPQEVKAEADRRIRELKA